MEHIARPALATRLASLLETGHLLLVAGAGWGKTTALEQCLEQRGGVTVWVRCSEFDRDPGRLLADLVEALERGVPGAADVLADRLASATGPVDQARAARELALELERLVVGPLTIVLDDCERLGDSAEAWTAVSPLLETGAPALRLALASRRRPPLRLARQRAGGRVTEVGAGELAFSPTECEEAIRLARGREPAREEVDAVWSATEGWPLGVALTAAARGGGAGVRDGLAEFFDEEILDGSVRSCARRPCARASPRRSTRRSPPPWGCRRDSTRWRVRRAFRSARAPTALSATIRSCASCFAHGSPPTSRRRTCAPSTRASPTRSS